MALLDKGTRQYDAHELAAAQDDIAMVTSLSAGVEDSSFDYRILKSRLDDSLRLAAEVLQNPTFPQDELDKLKNQISAWLATLEKAPSSAAGSLFERAIYGADNPLGQVWTPALVSQVDRDMLEQFHDHEIAPDSITVFMIGDIEIDDARRSVEKAFGRWRADNRSARKDIGGAPPQRPRIVLVDQPGAVQSTIYAGHTIAPFDADISTELSLMNDVFGGMFESRINMNLREDKHWSYGMGSGIRQNRTGDQYFAVAGSVQTDRTTDSMQEIMRELEEFVSVRPATDHEVARVKLNRTRSLPGTYETNRGFLASIIVSDSYGLPFDYAESRGQRIEAVTTDGISARARATIHPDKLTWVVVGDVASIEEGVRELGYGDVEVWNAFGDRLR